MNKINNIKFIVSPNNKKKYRVYFTLDGKEHKLDFGAKGMAQYRDDALGVYSSVNHLDQKRRERYFKRHSDKEFGNNPLSPMFWSHRFLWRKD